MPTKTFALTGPINLEVRLAHGSVTVETEDALTEARVRIEPGAQAEELYAQTTVEMRGPTLVVSAPRPGGLFDLPIFAGRRGGRGLDVHIVVPSGTATKINTFTAPIRILGRVGGADLAFGAADAVLGHVDGDLSVKFGTGSAKAELVSGSVLVRSGSGNAEFGRVEGAVTAGSGSGNLEVRVAHGAVKSRCGSGSARLGEVHADVDVASGSGGVEIGLPAGVTAQLDVQTGAGRVRSDLPIEDRPTSKSGAIKLRARTGSGDVHLFRVA